MTIISGDQVKTTDIGSVSLSTSNATSQKNKIHKIASTIIAL